MSTVVLPITRGRVVSQTPSCNTPHSSLVYPSGSFTGSIPVTLSFADALKCNVLLLPMGRGDDGKMSLQDCSALC